MNKIKFIIIVIFILLTGFLYCEEFNDYAIIEVKSIPTGEEEGLIGWQPRIAGGFSGPTSFAINNEYIYVPDRVNYRINVYDLNFEFMKTITEKGKKNAHFALNLKTDYFGNLYYSFSDLGLIKIDNEGNQIFKVSYKELSNQVKQYRDFFPINNDIFIYNDEGEIQYIDNAGKINDSNKALIRLQQLTKNKELWKGTYSNGITIPVDKMQIIDTLRNSKKYILVGDNYYSTKFYKNKEYFEKIKEIRNYVMSKKTKICNKYGKKEIDINLDDYDYTLFGYDNEHNGYWGAGRQVDDNTRNCAIIVINKYGEILDGFYFGQYKKGEKFGLQPDFSLYPTSDAEVAIAPTGDVYFLTGSKEKYTLYKVERQW